MKIRQCIHQYLIVTLTIALIGALLSLSSFALATDCDFLFRLLSITFNLLMNEFLQYFWYQSNNLMNNNYCWILLDLYLHTFNCKNLDQFIDIKIINDDLLKLAIFFCNVSNLMKLINIFGD